MEKSTFNFNWFVLKHTRLQVINQSSLQDGLFWHASNRSADVYIIIYA